MATINDAGDAPPAYRTTVTENEGRGYYINEKPESSPLSSNLQESGGESVGSGSNVSAENSRIELSHDLEIRGESQCARSLRLFKNPLAHDEKWSVVPEDQKLKKLPSIDFKLKLKQAFTLELPKSRSGELPSFMRDPTDNPLFDKSHKFAPMSFSSYSKKSRYVGESFESQFRGHVFSAHDVSPADWYRFLEDLIADDKFGLPGKLFSEKAPHESDKGRTNVVFHRLFSHLVNDTPPILDVAETWREQFFRPRGIDLSITGENISIPGDAELAAGTDDLSNDISNSRLNKVSRSRPRREERKSQRRARKSANGDYGRYVIILRPLEF